MILLDLNQVMIANFMSQIGNHTDTKIDEGLFRHMVLNSIRSIKTKFTEYGELIIACDDKKLWRRELFPFYKANRKKTRDASELDWSAIFNTLSKLKLELKEYFPYRVIQIEGAEADDVIGTLTKKFNGEKILIVSGDKDFRQLQKYSNVFQYDPINKKYIAEEKAFTYLKELIIKGDRGDGIPNILSSDTCIVEGVRQKAISSNKLKEWLEQEPSQFLTSGDLTKNWNRNRVLIDLDCIPDDITEKIINEYYKQENKTREKIFNYLINNKMKVLIEHINEF